MMYTPWCGFCKKLKPEYAAAAKELKPNYVLAAIDLNRPENSKVRGLFNVTSFPTLIYFEKGAVKYQYEGDPNKDAIVTFMKNPTEPPPPKEAEAEWASDPDSEIVHLSTNNFDSSISDEASTLVLFYTNCKWIC